MLKIAWSEIYNHSLPEGHRFPMEKYDLVKEQLLYEGTIQQENLFDPGLLNEEIILWTHDLIYWEKLKNLNLSTHEARRIGFPISSALIERESVIMNGTVMAADFALQYGAAMNIAGGTHHAYSNKGEGFCLMNDNAIAANYLLKTGKARNILIIDLDVHQGNGTAEIFQDNKNVFTFSMHGLNNIFSQKEISNLDIDLPDGTTDKEYLSILTKALEAIEVRFTPDFIIYQSGVDVLESDKLGKLSMTKKGCKERDKIVIEYSKGNKLPFIASMGGGYSSEIFDIVEAHCNTFRLVQEIYF